jgi:hypothetical protein
MSADKKRTYPGSSSAEPILSPHPITVSSSSYTRRPAKRPNMAYANTSNGYSPVAQREPSPPASAYFANFPTDPDSHAEPIPLANAQEHFAYSTTLRRHHVEGHLTTPIRRGEFAEGFNALTYRLRQFWEQWKSGERELGLENGRGARESLQPPEPLKEGVSAIFASRSIEVSYWVVSIFIIFYMLSYTLWTFQGLIPLSLAGHNCPFQDLWNRRIVLCSSIGSPRGVWI